MLVYRRRAPTPASVRALLLLLYLQLVPSRVLCVSWTAVVSGPRAAHTCGLRAGAAGAGSGNDLYCWGLNDNGQLGLGYDNTSYAGCKCVPAIPSSPVLTAVSAVALGAAFTCALLTSGTVACWGANSYGQLGLGYAATTVLSISPIPSRSLSGVVAVAAGNWFTCAVTSGGALYCWGDNQFGELGTGTGYGVGSEAFSPVLVSGFTGVTAVACGGDHACALTSSGGVYCWGRNDFGQVGNGGTTNLETPPATPLLTGMGAVAAGDQHACALSSSGGVYCWGRNDIGEDGLGFASGGSCDCVTPPSSPVMTGVTQISTGGDHSCALKSGGVYCWGNDVYGQLGNGLVNTRQLSPPSVPVLTGVAVITAGGVHTCVLMTSGDMECWGWNQVGALGNGGTTDVNSPPSPSTVWTLSVTPSVSPTISNTPSITPTISTTHSFTRTVTATSSITPTISNTPSVSPTGSVTASLSSTISTTSSPSSMISITASPSPTISLTPSATPTVTVSPPHGTAISAGAVVGAAVGGSVGGLLLLFLLMYCCKRWSARRRDSAAKGIPANGPDSDIIVVQPLDPSGLSPPLPYFMPASIRSPLAFPQSASLPSHHPGPLPHADPSMLRLQLEEERVKLELQKKFELEARMLSTSGSAATFHYTAVLGAGSNGAVVLATCTIPFHPFPTKPYAVKLIFNFNNLSSHARRNAYMAEFQLLAALPSHPGIVRFYCRFDDEVPGELLALLPADTRELISLDMYGRLRERISTTFAVFAAHPHTLQSYRASGARVLGYASFVAFARQLLDALLFLEENGVQHRDLKQDNIMVKEDGRLCIIDFGEAVRYADPEDLQTVVCQGDAVFGNQAHIAPEVLNALATLSSGGRSVEVDFSGQAVFEAGVLLFELAVCCHPLEGYPAPFVSVAGVLAYPAEAACVLPSGVAAGMVRAGYPRGFTALIRRMVACEAAGRPSLREAAEEVAALTVSPL